VSSFLVRLVFVGSSSSSFPVLLAVCPSFEAALAVAAPPCFRGESFVLEVLSSSFEVLAVDGVDLFEGAPCTLDDALGFFAG
jgi:hypothetical protein